MAVAGVLSEREILVVLLNSNSDDKPCDNSTFSEPPCSEESESDGRCDSDSPEDDGPCQSASNFFAQ